MDVNPPSQPPPGWAARLASVLQRQRWIWIPLLVIGILAAGSAARTLKIDNSLSIWFLDDDPALIGWNEFKQQFGNDELVTIAVTDPTSVLSPAALTRVKTASERMKAHPKVRRVISVATGRHISGDAVEVRIEPLLPDGAIGPATGLEVRQRIDANPVYRGTLVSKDEKMTLIVVEPSAAGDIDAERPMVLADLRKIAEEELTKDGGRFHMGGMGVVYEGLNAASLRDTQLFATLSYVVVFVGLFLMFRRIIWVIIGAVVVTLATVGTVGVAALMGRDLNMVTAVLPTLIMTIGVLDLVHMVESYDEMGPPEPGRPTQARVISAVSLVLVPCLFNSITDMAGFIGLVSSPMRAIRDMGLLATVGLGLVLLCTLVITVPAISRFGGARPSKSEHRALHAAMARMFDFVARRPRTVTAFAVGIAAVSVVGMTKIDVDTYTIGFLSGSDPVREDHDAIEATFGPFVPYEFVVRTPKEGIKDPDVLRRIQKVGARFEEHERIGRTTALPDVIARVNQVVMDGGPEEYRIPDSREAVAQELLLYESDADNELDVFVDGDFTVTRVTARGGLPTARTIGETVAAIQATGQAELGAKATLEPSGYIPLYVRIIHHIARTQVSSFSVALAVITVVLMLLLRSIKLGLLALVPNVLPVMMVMGFMGFAGIRLDVATVLIASIVIGFAVNDTTHILYRFKHELGAAPDATEALRRTMLGTGKAVLASSLILGAGFSVLAFADVKSVSYFGLLLTVATMFALIADLIVTPAVVLSLKWKK